MDAAAVLIGGHGALQRLDLRSGRIVTFLENSTSKMLKNDTFLFGSHPQNASFGKVKQNIQNKKWSFLKMFLVCNLKKTSFG